MPNSHPRVDRFDNALQRQFITVQPRIRLHARIAFRNLVCASAKDDAISETIALAWHWYVRLVRQGKHPSTFVGALARFAARAVRSGRRLCGQERAKDAMSPVARVRHAVVVHLVAHESDSHDPALVDALIDNTQTPIPDQVSFRLDFPAWLATRTDRDRTIIAELMAGERTLDVSRRHRVSEARISQLRRQYLEDWQAFTSGRTADASIT